MVHFRSRVLDRLLSSYESNLQADQESAYTGRRDVARGYFSDGLKGIKMDLSRSEAEGRPSNRSRAQSTIFVHSVFDLPAIRTRKYSEMQWGKCQASAILSPARSLSSPN